MERLGWGSFVVAGAASIALTDKGNFSVATTRGNTSSVVGLVPPRAPTIDSSASFLRIPPFPGARIEQLTIEATRSDGLPSVAEDLRRLRVGGSYWGAQPDLPHGCLVVRNRAALDEARRLVGGGVVVLWTELSAGKSEETGVLYISGDCDPWHVLSTAAGLVTTDDDEVRLVAALLRVPLHLFSGGKLIEGENDLSEMLARYIPAKFENPFSGESMSARQAIELCGFWRRLIDSNRHVLGGLGFAFWKQQHVAPLLWNGSNDFRFFKSAAEVEPEGPVAIWRAKASFDQLAILERAGMPLIEVEDGFLRSRGLGADCIPPLSITVDELGAYFDPSRPSELERILQDGKFSDELIERARELRHTIVEAGIAKYEQGGIPLERPAGQRLHILVPGQVEDDRAVQTGGCGLTSNLELLKRVRAQAPDSYILYKPHPDVLAGHRRGAICDEMALKFADEIVGENSINSLLSMVDEVHVNTSLAGFEALLREKKVTTYGVPFYAGWGLTTDLGRVPSRRSAKRSLDELVAGTLLVYPRYLDPISGLPCPAEVVVARLAAGDASDPGLLVGVRRLQGKVMRRLRSLVQ
jgi:capsular polysaccharide export protein